MSTNNAKETNRVISDLATASPAEILAEFLGHFGNFRQALTDRQDEIVDLIEIDPYHRMCELHAAILRKQATEARRFRASRKAVAA